jgi:hypothetical protein
VIRTAAFILLALVLAGCNGGTVDRHALKRDAEKIGSLATEGQLLAHDVSRGASTEPFARVHAEELARAASNLADSLFRRSTLPDVRKLAALAGKVSDQLERLQLHPTDRAVARSLEQPLTDDADAADKLAK